MKSSTSCLLSHCLKLVLRATLLGVLFATIAVHADEPTGRYKNIVDKIKELNKTYPNYSSLISIGQNDEGTELYGLRISTKPGAVDPSKVGHLVVGTHHGNESHAATFVVKFMESLLKDYASSDAYRTNLADTEWTLIPVLNVTGYNANNRYERGLDPNRDYPGPCTSGAGGKLKSIRTMMDFAKSRIFTGSLTVHGYAGALTYPWGVDVGNTHTQDHNQFASITKKAAAMNGYNSGTSTDIVYPCDGSFEDYSYWKHGMWSLLLELESGSANDLAKTVEATRFYFSQLDSSPSVKNQLMSSCQRSGRPDLGIE